MSSSIPKIQPKKGFRRNHHKIGLPFPNYGTIKSNELPVLNRCYFDEESKEFFTVHQQDILTLYQNGAFGQSNLTHRCPIAFNEDMNYKELPYFAKLKAKEDSSSQNQSSSTRNQSYSETEDQSESNEQEERLILLPEEVIFLAFGVGCVTIQNFKTGEKIGYLDIWKDISRRNPQFPYQYAVYHFFRSKNWVPKPGETFGGDYLLYKIGPEFYHSSFVVHIQGIPVRPKLTWLLLHAMLRVASSSKKSILLVDLKIPSDWNPLTPSSIFQLGIIETHVNRWIPFGDLENYDED